jgi:hypothetical protein
MVLEVPMVLEVQGCQEFLVVLQVPTDLAIQEVLVVQEVLAILEYQESPEDLEYQENLEYPWDQEGPRHLLGHGDQEVLQILVVRVNRREDAVFL